MRDVTATSNPAPAPVDSAISGDRAINYLQWSRTVDTATVTTRKIASDRCVSADGAVLNRHCSTIENSAAIPARVTSEAILVATDRAAGNAHHACIVDATGGQKAHVRLNRPSKNDHGAGVGDTASERNS